MLQSEALVLSEPKRGYTVSPISPKELADITEARIGIEAMCLRGLIARGDLGWESVPLATVPRDVHGEHRAIYDAVRAVALLESPTRLAAEIVG